MNWTERLHHRSGRSEMLVWACACLLVTSAYAGAANWVLDQPDTLAGEIATAPAIMIDLALEPEAVHTEMNRITEDRVDAERHMAVDPVLADVPDEPVAKPVSQKAAVDKVEPTPERLSGQPVDSLEKQMLAALEDVAVPLPLARPHPVAASARASSEKPARVMTKPASKPASKAATKAAATVKVSRRDAAPAASAGTTGSSASTSRWKARVAAHLDRRKRYPSSARANRQQGTALVRFQIDTEGRVLSTALARSSGFAELDQAAVAMVLRASPVPPPPPGAGTTLTAPVKFMRR